MSRVLSTEEAKQAITQMKAIINNGLAEQIQALDNQGKRLSEVNVWDGPLAETFRTSTWPQTRSALEKAKSELDQLHGQLDKISADIFRAGGA